MRRTAVLFLTILISFFSLPALAAGFEAGVAIQDITPEPGIAMWGYSSRSDLSQGTIDPLHARAIVFRAGGNTAAIVTLDLGRVPLPDACGRIRRRAKAQGVDYVLLTASHTHQAPAMDVDKPYTRTIEGQIGDVIEAALAKLQPARIGVGRTTIDISHNRRKILDDGQCMMVWRNEEQISTGIVDHEAGLVKITDDAGNALAVLVNYACHPVVLGADNLRYSADFVGEMARVVKERTGAECLFLQGASGDVNPYMDKTPVDEGGIETMRQVGRTAGFTVLSALDAIQAVSPAEPSVAFTEKRVEVGTRWDLRNPAVRRVLRQAYGPLFDKYLAKLDPKLAVPLGTIVLNNDLALVGMPGELFTQFQLDLKTHSPLRNTFLVGYAHEFHIYFPTVKDAVYGGYGAAVNSYVGLGAGNKLVREGVIQIGQLIGKLPAVPKIQDFQLLEGSATDE